MGSMVSMSKGVSAPSMTVIALMSHVPGQLDVAAVIPITHVISLWDPPKQDETRREIDEKLDRFARHLPDARVLPLYFDDIPRPVEGFTAVFKTVGSCNGIGRFDSFPLRFMSIKQGVPADSGRFQVLGTKRAKRQELPEMDPENGFKTGSSDFRGSDYLRNCLLRPLAVRTDRVTRRSFAGLRAVPSESLASYGRLERRVGTPQSYSVSPRAPLQSRKTIVIPSLRSNSYHSATMSSFIPNLTQVFWLGFSPSTAACSSPLPSCC